MYKGKTIKQIYQDNKQYIIILEDDTKLVFSSILKIEDNKLSAKVEINENNS